MTEISITPVLGKKQLKVSGGKVAVGEKVAIAIVGFASKINNGHLRLRFNSCGCFGGGRIAQFPLHDEDAWGADGDDAICELTLNTVQAKHFFGCGGTCEVVLDDVSVPQLYGVCALQLYPWKQEPGGDEPYDLRGYPDDIAGFRQELNEFGENVNAAKIAAEQARRSAIVSENAAKAAGSDAAQMRNALPSKADLVSGKVPETQLPSYVDDVIEYPSISDFPEVGERGKIYVAIDTNKTYRWSGSAYIQVGGESNEGTARPLPDYLYALDFADSYKAEAEAFYEEIAGDTGAFGCSAVRRGNNLFRNYDWTFDSAAEFVVRVSGNASRFSSVGVASVGEKLTDAFAKSGKWSKYYKCLPGMTLDGINEKGVVAEINVDGGSKTGWHGTGANALHILAAVRWVLDRGETAATAAQYLAENVKRPTGLLNFHFMIADATSTYIVENGEAHDVTNSTKVLTNYAVFGTGSNLGEGVERYNLLASDGDITDVWFTKAYQQGNDWDSDFASAADHQSAITQWAEQGDTKESHRGKTTSSGKAWWHTVHTSVYDFENKTMKVAVQESEDYYTFALIGSGTGGASLDPTMPTTIPTEDGRGLTKRGIWSAIWGALTSLPTGFTSLYDWCVAQFGKKVNAVRVTIPVGAYTFTNGKNGFQAWAWKDENDEWRSIAINKPSDCVGPYITLSTSGEVGFEDATRPDDGALLYFEDNSWRTMDSATREKWFDGGVVNEITSTAAILYVTDIDDEPSARSANAITSRGVYWWLHTHIINHALATIKGKAADALYVKNALEGKLAKTAVIDPSTATTSGKAADAFAVKNALAAKFDKTGGEISGVVDIRDWLAVGKEGGGVQITGIFIRGSETGAPGNVVIMGDGGVYLAGTFEDAKNGNFIEHYGNIYDIKNIIKKLDIVNLAPAFSSSTTYAKDVFVSHGGKFYISKTDGNFNHTPPNTTYWTLANLLSLFSSDNGKLVGVIDTKIDAKIGDINDALDEINGEVA